MSMTLRRFIAVYSPSTVSAETRLQANLFVLPELETDEQISVPTFLAQIALAKRAFPLGYRWRICVTLKHSQICLLCYSNG